jgi:23S rRNA pseudouridine2605 synthase
MITQGRVVVNGKVVRELGTKVNPDADDVRVDGIPVFVGTNPRFVYVMLNKPVGVVSTASDPNAGTTVLDLVAQIEERVYPVGRLDADSAGLLLLTNDGDFANRLTHPRYHVPKIYRVRARGFVEREEALTLANGIDLPDGRTAPADVTFVDYDAATQCTILDITLYEGRNRQIRRMMETIEHPVKALTRIGFGNLRLQGLVPGTWRKLRPEEVADLLALAQPTATPKKEERRIKLPYRPRNPQRPDVVEPTDGKPRDLKQEPEGKAPGTRAPKLPDQTAEGKSPGGREGRAPEPPRLKRPGQGTENRAPGTRQPRELKPGRGGKTSEPRRPRSRNKGERP